MNKSRVAVVILNWNGKAFLEKFLPGLIKYTSDDATLIIADNNSSDDSVSFVKENYPDIQLVINPENGGFAKGYNDALKYIDYEYYVLLNSDIEIKEKWINPIIKYLDENLDVAIAQPKLLAYHNNEQFEYAGAAGGFIDKYGYPFCRGRIFDTIENDNGQYDDIKEIFWATGAAMFIRSKVFHQQNGFDETFFAHMEEIDLCWRVKNTGLKIIYHPESRIYHVGGGTLPKSSSRKTYFNFRNNLFLLYKNIPKNRLFIVFYIKFNLDLLAAFVFALKGDFASSKAVFKAYRDFFKHKKEMKAKRKAINQKKNNCIYNKSIVYQYQIKKKKKYSELV